MATKCTTWNYYDKADDLSLSVNDLVATNTVDEWRSIRSKMCISAGKWYWEIRPTKVSTYTSMTRIGIADVSANLELPPGAGANEYTYSGTGDKYNGGSGTSFGETYGSGCVIGIALDLDDGKIWFSKNGIWQDSGNPSTGANPAYTGITGIFYAIAGIYGIGDKLVCDFGAGGLTHNVPTGFRDGLCAGAALTSAFRPVASNDDGFWEIGGVDSHIHSSSGLISFGTMGSLLAYGQWVRFPAINTGIPVGATISSAFIRFTCSYSSASDPLNVGSCFFVGDADAIPTTPTEADALVPATGTVLWTDIPQWISGSAYDTPELLGLLQPILNDPGWALGSGSGSGSVMNLIKSPHRDLTTTRDSCSDNDIATFPELRVLWFAPPFDSAAWGNSIKICILGSPCITEDLRDFPVYINLSDDSGYGSEDLAPLFDELGGDSLKIAITTPYQAEQCYIEIERWDAANNKAELWVKVPVIPAGVDSFLWLFYNSAQPDNTTYVGATGTPVAQHVWDGHYTLVAHLANPVASLIDSTTNGNNGTSFGVSSVDSKIGKGAGFPGSSAHITLDTKLAQGAKTIEAIFYTADASHSEPLDVLIGETEESPPFHGSRLSWNHVTHQIDWRASSSVHAVSNVAFAGSANYYVASAWDGATGSGAGKLYISGDLNAQANVLTAESQDPFGNTKIGMDHGTSDRSYNSKSDEIRFSDIERSAAWIKATYCSNWDILIRYFLDKHWDTDPDPWHTGYFDLPTEITVSEEEDSFHKDLKTDIAVSGWGSFYKDLKLEITVAGNIFNDPEFNNDLEFNIAATKYLFKNVETEIAILNGNVKDLKTEIAADFISAIGDLKTEIIISGYGFTDLKTDIAAEYITDFKNLKTEIIISGYGFTDLKTDIEIIRCKHWLKTEIIAGCAARWYYTTEWNPDRFLKTEIKTKRPYTFNFNTVTGTSYAMQKAKAELLVPGYFFPIQTLFLDYLRIGTANEYTLNLWWARGLSGKNPLKNAKIKAEYIDTQYISGYEVVTCDWLSGKIGDGGSYQTISETPLDLGDIPCDSFLDFRLKVDCRDCSLTRGFAYFKLYIIGDFQEAVYGGQAVYKDGKAYHSGFYDDYCSDAFVCRLYIY